MRAEAMPGKRRRPLPARLALPPALWLLLVAVVLAAPVVSAAAAPGFARTPAELLGWMDSDGDGRVALLEYQHYLSRGFRALDSNGDGVIATDELPAGVSSRGRRAPVDLTGHERALARSFERQDADADGFLDAIELAAPPR